MARRPRLPIPPALLALAALASCTGDTAPTPPSPNLSTVLITLDTTRADALGCYGRTEGVTPHLDQLRAEGILYEAAYSVAPLTLPAHASMLTGLYPLRHGVRDNGLWPLSDSARTLAETARDAGLQTAAFIAAPVLSADFGLAQGFETYDSPTYDGNWENHSSAKLPAKQVVDATLAWLGRRDPDRRFFLWVHLFDPHSPYRARPQFDAAMNANRDYPNRKYIGEVAYMDRQVGRLLDALREEGLIDDCLVLAIADHGESLKAHGETTHGAYCYDETMRVPMILRYPGGYQGGESSTETVSVVDVHPTLAAAMGLAIDAGLDGVDGTSLFLETVPEDRGVYFECYSGFLSYGWSPIAGWLDARGKYIHSSTPELYDLRNDPAESRDLIASRAEDAARYVDAIGRLASRPALDVAEEVEVDDQLYGQLRSLGYAGVGLGADQVPHPLAPSDLPSPAEMLGAHNDMSLGIAHANAGRFGEAETVFRRVLAVNPKNYVVLDLLSFCLMQQQRHGEAVPLLQWLVREGPQKASYYFNLGICLHAEGRLESAIPVLQRGVELDPREPRFRAELCRVLDLAGYAEEARLCERKLEELQAGT